MRLALDVSVRAAVVVALWVAWPDTPTTGPGAAWLLFATISLVGLLWGVVDGLLADGSLTGPIMRWASAAPAIAVLVPVLGGLAGASWPAGIDVVRWVFALTAMLYFMLVLPAALGVALGSGVQGLHRWPSRG
ncbi:MAG: hypothetical protein ACLGH4_01265 [Actinomycetes bacterium]